MAGVCCVRSRSLFHLKKCHLVPSLPRTKTRFIKSSACKARQFIIPMEWADLFASVANSSPRSIDLARCETCHGRGMLHSERLRQPSTNKDVHFLPLAKQAQCFGAATQAPAIIMRNNGLLVRVTAASITSACLFQYQVFLSPMAYGCV